MPKLTIQEQMQRLNAEQQKALLEQRARQLFEKNKKNYQKTLNAQSNDLDKIYALCLMAAKSNLHKHISDLDPATRYELGDNPDGELPGETELRDQYTSKIVGETISAPKPAQNAMGLELDMEEVRRFYQNLGLINAKAAYDLAQERDAVYASLGDGYDAQTKDDLADYLTSYGGSLSARTLHGTQTLQGAFAGKMADEERQLDYDSLLQNQLRAQFSAMLGDQIPPAMTVRQYMDSVNMRENLRQTLLKNMNCKPEDNLYQVVQAEQDQKMPGKKLDQLEGEAKRRRAEQLHGTVMNLMTGMYLREAPRGWMNEGTQRFEAGLQPSERERFRKGHRLANPDEYDFKQVKKRLDQKAPDYDLRSIKLRDQNAKQCFHDAERKLISGESLKMRQAYGVSESFSVGRPGYERRSFLMAGIVKSMVDGGSVWKHHSKNSKSYEKMLSSMKDYRAALAAGEGGKARDLRQIMVKNCWEYVKDKGKLCSEEHGQNRFDNAMMVLRTECKPEVFQQICDHLNKSRGKEDKIPVTDYDDAIERYIRNAKEKEAELQMRSQSAVTAGAVKYREAVNDMVAHYGPSIQDSLQLKAVGRNSVLKEDDRLSDMDYAALSFGSTLSSRHRPHEANRNLLEQNPEAVKEGKDVTKAAMNAYARGNREPLARLINQCLQNMKAAAAEDRPAAEHACLDEMSSRLREMAERDPELKKIAVHNGMDAAPAANQPDQPALKKDAVEAEQQPVLQ